MTTTPVVPSPQASVAEVQPAKEAVADAKSVKEMVFAPLPTDGDDFDDEDCGRCACHPKR